MSEQDGLPSTANAANTPATDAASTVTRAAGQSGTTAGALLRQARQAKGLHIAALAASLKVPQRKLEALEADRYTELPDATFARALAQTMCRALKVDPTPVLALLPHVIDPELDRVARGLNQPFRDRPGREEPSPWAWLQRPGPLGALVLVLASVGIYLAPASVWDFGSAPAPSPAASEPAFPPAVVADSASDVPQAAVGAVAASAAASSLPVAALGAASAAVGTGPVLVSSAASAGTLPTAPLAAKPATALAVPAAAATPSPLSKATPAPGASSAPNVNSTASLAPASSAVRAAVAPAPNASSVPSQDGPLRLRAKSQTWIEVQDASGKVLLSRTLQTGEQAAVDGVPPFKLKIGNVAGTELQFRGQAVDLASRTRDNVARFDLP